MALAKFRIIWVIRLTNKFFIISYLIKSKHAEYFKIITTKIIIK